MDLTAIISFFHPEALWPFQLALVGVNMFNILDISPFEVSLLFLNELFKPLLFNQLILKQLPFKISFLSSLFFNVLSFASALFMLVYVFYSAVAFSCFSVSALSCSAIDIQRKRHRCAATAAASLFVRPVQWKRRLAIAARHASGKRKRYSLPPRRSIICWRRWSPYH